MTSAAPEAQARLDALATRLAVYKDLEVEPVDNALRIRSTEQPGCCLEIARRGDKVRCRPRPDDRGRLWFFTSWNEPIAEARHVIDASVAIHGYVANSRSGAGTPRGR